MPQADVRISQRVQRGGLTFGIGASLGQLARLYCPMDGRRDAPAPFQGAAFFNQVRYFG
jgi:hypothetical protein